MDNLHVILSLPDACEYLNSSYGAFVARKNMVEILETRALSISVE